MILDRLNYFGWVQIVLVGYKSFWLGSNKFFWTNFNNMDLSKLINYPGSVQNHFGSIEGQGTILFIPELS